MEEYPVDGIDVFSDPPRIQDPCIHCWRCVNVCPTLAIEADWSMMIDNAPNEFKHYRRELEMAEAGGRIPLAHRPRHNRLEQSLDKTKRKQPKPVS